MSHKAIYLKSLGAPFELGTRETPKPAQNELLMKIKVVGLNPHDSESRDTGLLVADQNDMPAIAGNDIVGVVAAVGSAVTRFKLGDRIFAQADHTRNREGGLQEYALLPETLTGRLPDSISDDEAATVPTNALAPFISFFAPEDTLGELAAKFPDPKSRGADGRSIVIIGGGSNTGKFALQFARFAGFKHILAVARKTPESEKELKALGATEIIDRLAADSCSLALRVLPSGADIVYDTVNRGDGAHTFAATFLRQDGQGRLVVLNPGTVDQSKLSATSKIESLFSEGSGFWFPEEGPLFWTAIPEMLENSSLKPLGYTVIQGLDVDKINQLMDAYKEGKPVTKTHFHVA